MFTRLHYQANGFVIRIANLCCNSLVLPLQDEELSASGRSWRASIPEVTDNGIVHAQIFKFLIRKHGESSTIHVALAEFIN